MQAVGEEQVSGRHFWVQAVGSSGALFGSPLVGMNRHNCRENDCAVAVAVAIAAAAAAAGVGAGAAGSGSLWHISGREVARGFTSSVAFRCDRSKPKAPSPSHPSTSGERGAEAEDRRDGGGGGRIGFVVHNHRAALSGDEGDGGPATSVSNGLSVCLHLDGAGGGEVSLRCTAVYRVILFCHRAGKALTDAVQ